jgi:hypothetical protein
MKDNDTSLDFDTIRILSKALITTMASPTGSNVEPLEQVNEWT